MRIRFSGFAGLCSVVLLSFVLAFSAVAQDKKAKTQNVQGNVVMHDKKTSTITVDAGTAKRQVMYSAATKFGMGHTKDNKPGTSDKVDVGNFITCNGAMDKGVLMATDCVYRDKK